MNSHFANGLKLILLQANPPQLPFYPDVDSIEDGDLDFLISVENSQQERCGMLFESS